MGLVTDAPPDLAPREQVTGMKPTQVVLLLLVVVALIFGVTFATMYVGQQAKNPTRGPKNDSSGNLSLQLSFASTAYPEGEVPATEDRPARPRFYTEEHRLVTEFGQRGHCDFWFVNPHSQEVRVGVLEKNCTCSEVRPYLIPEGEQALTALLAAGLAPLGQDQAAGAVACRLSHLADFACGDAILRGVAERAKPLEEMAQGNREGAAVPGKSFGFIRLGWEARRGGAVAFRPDQYKATLWMQNRDRGGHATLEVAATLAEGLSLDVPELDVGSLVADEVSRHVVRCWSVTRDDFDLNVTSTGEPFIQVGPREPLTSEDRAQLSARSHAVVRSGYRYPVVVREKTEKGAHFDEGPFNHALVFKPVQKVNLGAPLEVPVRGRVSGDIVVGSGDQAVRLQPFKVRDGTSVEVPLHTARADLNLSVERVPPFMTVRLSEPKREGGRKTWTLTLEIGPNKVSGSFPRAESEQLRDTAIYLKIEGADRRLRIPVSGNALQ
jgi:hypothetical protein